MPYFLTQFAVILAIALLLGVVVGWLIWGGSVEAPAVHDDEGAAAFRERMLGAEPKADPMLQGQVDELAAQLEAREADVARLRKRLRRVTAEHSAALAAAGASSGGADAAADRAAVEASVRASLRDELRAEVEADVRAEIGAVGVGGAGGTVDDAQLQVFRDRSSVAERERDEAMSLMREYDEQRMAMDAALNAERDRVRALESQLAAAAGDAGGPVDPAVHAGQAADVERLRAHAITLTEANGQLADQVAALREQLVAAQAAHAAHAAETERISAFGAAGATTAPGDPAAPADEEVAALRAQIDELNDRAAQAVRFANEAERARAELGIARVHSEQAQARIDAAIAQANAAQEAAAQAAQRAEEAQARAASYESLAESTAASVRGELQTRIDELERQSAAVRHELDAAAQRLTAAEQEAARRLDEAASSTAAERESHQQRLAAAETRLSEIASRADAADAQAARLAEELAATRASAESGQRAAQDALDAAQRAARDELAAAQQAARDEVAAAQQLAAHQLAAAEESGRDAVARAADEAAQRVEREAAQRERQRIEDAVRRERESAEEMLQRLRGELEARLEEQQAQLTATRRADESRIRQLSSELSDAKLRADAAQGVMRDLAGELQELREWSARQHSGARQPSGARPSAAFGSHAANDEGRRLAAEPSTAQHLAMAVAATSATPDDDLAALPGGDRRLAADLNELGILSFRQVGEWNDADIDRLQAMLPERPNFVRNHDWVLAARRLWAEKHRRPWAERGAEDEGPLA